MTRKVRLTGFVTSLVALVIVALFVHTPSDRSDALGATDNVESAQESQHDTTETTADIDRPINIFRSQEDRQGSEPGADRDNVRLSDEANTREWVREETSREIDETYSLLLDHLEITSAEKEAMLALLIEDAISNTRTAHSSGEGMTPEERSDRIAAIIGESKLEQFLALEGHSAEYTEVERIRAMLDRRNLPLSDRQRDGFLEILISVRGQDTRVLGSDTEPGSIRWLEQRVSQMDEYERLVMELAPSVLSSKQVEYVFDRYHRLSYNRALSLSTQRDAIINRTRGDDVPLTYPGRQ